eukprot:TRINITY_DN950_c0_g2_i1.p1 TRINITY_DN950_c0_g2~~TRINITY_DN950_c0_g2_i1.p1  ORF type:complete len:586 (+),score=157.86 TRINITY_DN950_c0_g2_i1:55-1758(+)
MKVTVGIVVLIAAFFLAYASAEVRVRMEEEHLSGEIRPALTAAPAGWKQLHFLEEHALEKDSIMKLIFVMKYSDNAAEELEDLFWEVSDPTHPNYGKYLTNEEIAAIVAPPEEHVERLVQYLNSFEGVTVESVPVTRDFVRAFVPLSAAQTILGCRFAKFVHESSNINTARCLGGYSLPASIAEVVSIVSGVTRFPSIRRAKISKESIGLSVDPRIIRARYNISDTVGGLSSQNSQAVHQFLGQYYSPADLAEFFLLFEGLARGDTPTVIGPDNGQPGIEASLDIEYIMSIGAKIPTQFWSNQFNNPNEDPFLDWMYLLNNATNPPLVNSISYGDNEEDVSRAYAHACNAQFQKAALRGLSILFAAGDSGVGGASFGCKKFVPDFPAVSPYITVVGGTQLGLLDTGNEHVWPDGGGGFSNYFGRPAYQETAVSNYLANTEKLPASTYYNSSGRAYPDISALASDFVIVVSLKPLPGVGGTSCATPTFSAVIALVNDLRLSKGLPALGFLNPWLYQNGASNPQIFTDITSGSNPGCSTNGFPAAVGWDASSGWGSPLYGQMAAVAVQN